ncbi:MAG: D-aminoacyl-tRNA deacylase [Asgard group archaeon]|nr:D-aminoacyl-tRNA deacylase [Asgard group archaeon]
MLFKKPLIITSQKSICSKNIFDYLRENYGFSEKIEETDKWVIFKNDHCRLASIEDELIYADFCQEFDSDLLIFGSRHASASNKPSLLTHVTGNFSDDISYGGEPYQLATVSTRAIKLAYTSLKEQQIKRKLTKFDVSVEATHHGPTNISTPLLFIEVGSTDIEYKNMEAIAAVSETIMKVANIKELQEIIPCICFGGGHYATRFNEIMEDSPAAIGHILPKYQRDNLTKKIVQQMIEKTLEKVQWAVIDRNSLNKKLVKIIEAGCETYNVDVVKARDIKYQKIDF